MSGWFRTRDGGLIICARCGCPAPVDTLSLLQYESNYCPKCGKYMHSKALQPDRTATSSSEEEQAHEY